jgi:hypothetical protein
MPTGAEADLVADVRRVVSKACGIIVDYTEGAEVYARFAELIARRGVVLVGEDEEAVDDQLSIYF